MKKKFLFLFFILFGLNTLTFSQNSDDVVYLKNGDVVKGTILEQGTPLKIKTPDGKILVFQAEYIEKVTKENDDNFTDNKKKIEDRKGFTGYRGFLEIGGGYAVLDNVMFLIQTTHGYQFNPYFFIGAGVGISNIFVEKILFVPVFADFRVNFTKKPISPFFDFKVGYSVSKEKRIYVSPCLGISFAFNESSALNLGVGYNMLTSNNKEYYSSYNYYLYESKGTHSVHFNIGFEF
ncbi:MAG: hypothetical protein PUB21_01275 [Bacteroidales bacterium]|nr:hypothetical protein [Bacteroidales bacterium]